MKLLVGLGNPGEKYENTRHNVGFMVVDYLAREMNGRDFKINSKFEAEICQVGKMILVKPQTYMNESGRAVRKVADYFNCEPDDVWVVHDDLDIVWGDFKIHKSKGPKIHNGVNSVEKAVGSIDFWRVRVGVDNRDPLQRQRLTGRSFVLKKLDRKEQNDLAEVIKDIVTDIRKKLDQE